MSYLISHTSFAFGIPELIALIFMIGVIVLVSVKLKKLKDAHEELANKCATMNADKVMESKRKSWQRIN